MKKKKKKLVKIIKALKNFEIKYLEFGSKYDNSSSNEVMIILSLKKNKHP